MKVYRLLLFLYIAELFIFYYTLHDLYTVQIQYKITAYRNVTRLTSICDGKSKQVKMDGEETKIKYFILNQLTVNENFKCLIPYPHGQQ